MFVTWRLVCVAVITLAGSDVRATLGRPSVSLLGSGASFPSRLYVEWAAAFKAFRKDKVQLQMTYKSTGSGQGNAMTIDRRQEVHYAGSDLLLTNNTYRQVPDLQMLPTSAG